MDQLEEISKLPDGSSSLNIVDLLDRCNYEDRERVLNLCLSKIGIGDTITIEGDDINALFFEYIYGAMDPKATNNLIYNKKSIGSRSGLTASLLRNGFKIKSNQTRLGTLQCGFRIIAER